MIQNFTHVVNQVFQILALNSKIDFSHAQLPRFANDKILTSLGDVSPLLTHHLSPLSDSPVDLAQTKQIAKVLMDKQAVIGLDHLGFCYKVDSVKKERERLGTLATIACIPLYEELSEDEGLWLFVGDITSLNNPVTEFVPVESSKDKDVDYWLPHLQIDINTSLDDEEIITLIKNLPSNELIPFQIKIHDVTYIVRYRIGCVDGINIFLDLATKHRDVAFLRREIWKRIF